MNKDNEFINESWRTISWTKLDTLRFELKFNNISKEGSNYDAI